MRIQWQRCSLRTVSNRRVSCVYLGSLLPDHVLVVLGTWVLLHVITRDVLCANRMGRTLFGASATSATEIGPAILCYGQEVNVCICTHAHYVCMYTQSNNVESEARNEGACSRRVGPHFSLQEALLKEKLETRVRISAPRPWRLSLQSHHARILLIFSQFVNCTR